MMKHGQNPFCEWPLGNGWHCNHCCARLHTYESFLKHLEIHKDHEGDEA